MISNVPGISVALAAADDHAPQRMSSRDDIARDTAKDTAGEDQMQASLAATIREGNVVMRDGQKYRAFHSKSGVLLVPISGPNVRPEDFEAALCTPSPQAKVSEKRMIAGAERPLSKKLTAYAGLMAQVFRQKCFARDEAPQNPAKVSPEVGLYWDNGSKSGGQDRLFLNPMGAGFGASF